MDDNTHSQLFSFDSPLNQSSYIKVIGVGGGGNNAVNHMYKRGVQGVDFIVANTDMKPLNSSPVANKLALGHGLGAGGNPSKARKAAEEKEAEIKELFSHNTKMIFITAGMGGGTGTGAAPVIARFAKEIQLDTDDETDSGKILVVAVVTTPFWFEGTKRLKQAEEGVEELRKYVDSILVINNDKLRAFGNLVMSDAFSMANDVLLTAVKGIAEIITLNAFVNIDFQDVNTVMENSGTALMGIGEGEGENRACCAVEQAATSVLLNDNDISGAKNVLLYFSYGPESEITMDEVTEVTDYLNAKTGSHDTNIIWGAGSDDTLGEKLKITLIATGFDVKEAGNNYEGGSDSHDINNDKPDGNGSDSIKDSIPSHISEPSGMNPVNQFTPIEKVSPNPQTTQTSVPSEPSTPRIFILDDGLESKKTATIVETANPNEPKLITHNDVENRRQQPVAPQQPAVPQSSYRQPSSDPISSPAATDRSSSYSYGTQHIPSPLDLEAMNQAERIQVMHDILRNNINGADIIESMRPTSLSNERLADLVSAQQQNEGLSYLADGKVVRNMAISNIPD